ncbi:MAG: hypothetical protein ACKVOH_05970 [Chlamydiales bacterium]
MSLKNTLTNERLNDRFANPFKLVNHAIVIAKQMVARGEGMHSHLATEILEQVADQEDAVEDEGVVE